MPDDFPSTLESVHGGLLNVAGLRPPLPLLPRLPGYEVLAELGRAGMGVVYKARQLREDRLVAVKMLRDGVLAGAEQFERFCNEAQILARLEHPHIIRVYEVGELDGRLYMVLRYAEGGSLAARLTAGRVPADEAAPLIETLARAVHHVHEKGILHRDLKPANILLDGAGQPLIADFGLGKRSVGPGYTLDGAILGTPAYMSPEQAEGKKELRPTTDVYSLGAIFYELLTGRPPFQGVTVLDTLDQVRTQPARPPGQSCPELPAALEAVCLKCLEKEPRDRYATAEELADELRRASRGETLRLTGPGRGEDDRRARIAVCVQQGTRSLDRGENRLALLWFAEGLRLEQGQGAAANEEPHRQRVAAVLGGLSRLTGLWAPPSPITRAEFSPTGRRVVLGHEDGRWRVLKPSTGAVICAAEGHVGSIIQVSFSPDGERLVSGSDDGTARVWDARTGQPLSPPLRHRQGVTHAAFHPDGRHVVTAAGDGTAAVWCPDAGRPLFPPVAHGGRLWAVHVSLDGGLLVTAGWDGCARLWDGRSGASVAAPLRHEGWVRQAVFSRDGHLVATASDDQKARIWTRRGEPAGPPLAHSSAVRRVAFSRDGSLLLTWTADGQARAWEVATGAARRGPLSPVWFGADAEQADGGRRYLECGADGVLRLWDRAGSATAPDSRPIDEIVRLAQLFSGRRLDAEGNIQPLEPRLALAAWQELRRQYPATFRASEPKTQHWHEKAALVCERVGLWSEGAAHLRLLARSQPTNALAWARRGRLWARAGRWDRALADYTRAVRLDRGEWVYRYCRGLANERLGRFDRAVRDLGRAATLDRDRWQPWYHLGLLRARLGRHRDALNDLTRVLRRQPDCRSAYALRGCLAAHLKQWRRARQDFAEADVRGDERPWGRYQHALVCLRLGDHDGYEGLCQKLAAQAQRSGDAHLEAWTAWVCVLDQSCGVDPQRVLSWAEHILSVHGVPGASLQSFAHTLLGAALLRVGRIDEAIERLAQSAVPDSPWDWLFLSLAHQQAGNLRAARQWLRRAHRWLGRTCSTAPASARAALLWTQALELKLLRRQAEAVFRANPGPLVRLSRRPPSTP